MNLPPLPSVGEPITRAWGEKMIACVRAIWPRSSPTVQVCVGPGGATFRAIFPPRAPQSSALRTTTFFPLRIISSDGDSAAQLVLSTGAVEFLVAGDFKDEAGATIPFRLVPASAADPDNATQQVHIVDLPDEADGSDPLDGAPDDGQDDIGDSDQPSYIFVYLELTLNGSVPLGNADPSNDATVTIKATCNESDIINAPPVYRRKLLGIKVTQDDDGNDVFNIYRIYHSGNWAFTPPPLLPQFALGLENGAESDDDDEDDGGEDDSGDEDNTDGALTIGEIGGDVAIWDAINQEMYTDHLTGGGDPVPDSGSIYYYVLVDYADDGSINNVTLENGTSDADTTDPSSILDDLFGSDNVDNDTQVATPIGAVDSGGKIVQWQNGAVIQPQPMLRYKDDDSGGGDDDGGSGDDDSGGGGGDDDAVFSQAKKQPGKVGSNMAAYNKAPGTWFPGMAANAAAHSISVNTAGAATPSLPALTDAQADPVSGDVVNFIQAFLDNLNAKLAATPSANRPQNWKIRRNVVVNKDNSVTINYVVSVTGSGAFQPITG